MVYKCRLYVFLTDPNPHPNPITLTLTLTLRLTLPDVYVLPINNKLFLTDPNANPNADPDPGLAPNPTHGSRKSARRSHWQPTANPNPGPEHNANPLTVILPMDLERAHAAHIGSPKQIIECRSHRWR